VKPLLVQGGRVIDPSQRYDQVADVLVVNGKVEAVGPQLAHPKDCDILPAQGLVVSPGWVDIHTHLREPGGAHKETVRTGTEAAAAGGFTSIACMANTAPVNDNPYVTTYLKQRIATDAVVNVFPIGAVTKGLQGEELAEIGSMREAGVIAVSDDGKTVMNSYLMRKAFDYSKRFELAVITHAEDCNLKGKGVMNEGFNSARFGLRGIPRTSEDLIVARDILLAELTGARLHIAHVSTIGSVGLIREAKRRGIAVTAEVTPHHLTLTDDAVAGYDTNTKMAPPLRETQDVEALQEAVADGTIDALATDHAPHAVEDKQIEYDAAEFGIVGLETAFPLYYRLCLHKHVGLDRVIAAMTHQPALILGIRKGTLQRGADGDITVFDPQAKFTIDKRTFRSKSQNTPFHGWDVQGKVCYTVVGGRLVYEASRGIL
jgi:dihydroorotase